MRQAGMQSTHACIFARFTRKMHVNDTMLESGCVRTEIATPCKEPRVRNDRRGRAKSACWQ